MTDIAKTENSIPTVSQETSAVMSMIERVASDPNADVSKLEKMLDMQERIFNKNAEMAFNVAMNDAQNMMGPISADAVNPQTKSKYASYARLDGALRPIYTSQGFSLSFGTEEASLGFVRVICFVSHKDGHSRKYQADMPADGLGAKGNAVMTKTHAAGSAMSYGMRYLLKLIFNVAVGESDDDGNMADLDELAGAIADLKNAETMNDLQSCFKRQWNSFQSTSDRKRLTAAKDQRKGELA